ncbi:MAG: epoxide hydrolase family protein [Candidatus Binatia bacterium]
MKIEPFHIHVPDAVIADLQARLRRTRWPDQIADSGWTYGTDVAYMRELVQYWLDDFDWRAQEAALNRFAHFRTEVDGFGLHYIHEHGRGAAPLPLLISHGWPGSFVEFTDIIGPLTDPAAHGGDPADAFDLVIPSLPGYGFSDRPAMPGMDVTRVAALLAGLMDGLGYRRFGAQGGDWGAAIATALGAAFGDRVCGIHLNMLIAARPGGRDPATLSDEERGVLDRFSRFRKEETAYMQIQGTKPQTLGYALNDSPAGLAAWIVEKFRSWSDCGGDIERRFTKDRLLTNIMLYWVTETINSSIRLYYETMHNPALGGGLEGDLDAAFQVAVPTGAAIFPQEIFTPPRAWAERTYHITRWTEMPAGGHFAAMEEPAALVEDIRAFFRPLRALG